MRLRWTATDVDWAPGRDRLRASFPVLVFIFLIGPAAWQSSHALDAVLVGPEKVIVWKSIDAYNQGTAILSGTAAAAAEKLAPFIACVVPTGTPVTVERGPGGSWLWTAAVRAGQWTGCTGVIHPRSFQTGWEREAQSRPHPPEGSARPSPSPPAPPGNLSTGQPSPLPPIAPGMSLRQLNSTYSVLWKDLPALDRAVSLARAGVVDAQEYLPLIACMPPRSPDLMIRRVDMQGPLGIKLPWGVALHVVFDTGPQRGCRGFMAVGFP